MAVRLSLPPLDAALDPSVEVRPVYLEAWIEGLPEADVPELLEQTLASIERLNRQPLKPTQRLTLLDLHLRPYAVGLDFRRNEAQTETADGLKAQRLATRRLRRCAQALALGYKQSLSECLNRKSRVGGSKELAVSLQRASLFASLALLHCYDAHRPGVERLWLEVVAMYKYAAKAGLAETAVTAPAHDPLFARSTATTFKGLCLTSLVDPYHLAYGDIWRVYDAFLEYAPLASVSPVSDVSRPAGIFVIDPGHDGWPQPYGQVTKAPGIHCRLLDANPVLEALRARHAAGDESASLPSHVLAAMIRALGIPPRRYAPRERSDGRVTVAAGLSTIHYLLAGGASQAHPPADGEAGRDPALGSERADTDARRAAYRTEHWTIVNEGPGGIGISRSAVETNPLGVGEVVGLLFPSRSNGERDWTVGVVRWLDVDGEGGQQAGIEVLGTEATPVISYPENVQDTLTRIPRPALALPCVCSDAGATLIATRGLFQAGSRLRVIDGATSWLLEAAPFTESTTTFDRFGYSVVQRGS